MISIETKYNIDLEYLENFLTYAKSYIKSNYEMHPIDSQTINRIRWDLEQIAMGMNFPLNKYDVLIDVSEDNQTINIQIKPKS